MSRESPSLGVAAHWGALLLFPFDVMAACEGMSLRSFMSRNTGLSPAHLSQEGFNVKGARRLERISEHSQRVAREHLRDGGYSELEVDQLLAVHPKTPLAGFAYRLGQASPVQLAHAIVYCARVDRLAADVLAHIEGGDFESCKHVLADFLAYEAQVYASEELRHEVLGLRQAILEAREWQALVKPSATAASYALMAALAAVDVEWGARYLGRLQPVPTFFWMQPKFHPDFDPTNSKGLKRDVVARPTRHLFELLWAVAKRGTGRKEWPTEKPGPKELTQDIAHESTSDLVVRKWVSGAKPLRFDQAVELWRSLTTNLSGEGCLEVPVPWISLALWMERSLVRKKPGSSLAGTVIVLCHESYGNIWEGHRRRWADRLPAPADLPWPEWLRAQSSSPG